MVDWTRNNAPARTGGAQSLDPSNATKRLTWRVDAWCDAIDISRAHYYKLSPEKRPHQIKLGRRTLICEQPESYIMRMQLGAQEGVK